MEKQTSCIRKLGGSRAGEVRFGRFLRNPAVTTQEMLARAGSATGTVVAGRRVLVIQDTTELNFSGHGASKRGFGTVGNGVDIGLFLHPQVVLDAQTGGLLGLAGASLLNRTEQPALGRRSRASGEPGVGGEGVAAVAGRRADGGPGPGDGTRDHGRGGP